MAAEAPQSSQPTPDQLAAHKLLSELRTRIAVQRLPYQHGVEARALESLWEIFALARQAMKDHPGCEGFARTTTEMLNVLLRPVTAKWHRAHKAGLLGSRDGADAFRADLEAVRLKLAEFSLSLQDMAYGHHQPDAETPPVIDPGEVDQCFGPVPFGIAEQGRIPNAAALNRSEAAEITRRRETYGIATPAGEDAIGLALSGGGIRSATFCLGVVQVLAERGLMGQFDYLSSVSGGGYTGSLITSCVGSGEPFSALACPYGPDTRPVRHVRQNAKYLSANDLKERWLILAGTLAGMLLNWTAPSFILAAAAWLASMAGSKSADVLRLVAACLGVVTLALLLPYGILLRGQQHARRGLKVLAAFAGLTTLAAVALTIELGYPVFREALGVPWSIGGVAMFIVTLPAALHFLPVFSSPRVKQATFKVLILAAGLAAPVLAVVCFYLLRGLAEVLADVGAPFFDPLHYIGGSSLVALITVVCGLFAFFGLDVNATGPHKLYRDALAKTFVQTGNDAGALDLPLSALNESHAAPYHLINATVNLPSSRSPVLRDRRCDFFLWSKCWAGSVSTGYHETKEWKIGGNAVGLATAMAVSGAAASPQMGLASRPTLSALLTLLNIRLGLWVPRPEDGSSRTPGFRCLLREMTGTGMSETSPLLNLSDGGHIENMGIYELLRRRCKFILCVDGEADQDFTFHGQLTLVRHAQIDLGIRIDPRLDDVRLDTASGYSRSHAQLFRILYPPEGPDRSAAIGLMLYLKLSLTGNEAELLKRYRKLHPEFPHQSTADQFYDEEQFEAYRQLGVHVAEGTFSPALLTTDPTPTTIVAWFRQLAQNMLEPSTT